MVQRYEFITLRSGEGYLTKSDEGRLVSYENYETLIAQLEAAQQELIKPLPIGELVHRLEGQTYEKWFSESDVKDLRDRAQTAEAALSAANERLKGEQEPIFLKQTGIGVNSCQGSYKEYVTIEESEYEENPTKHLKLFTAPQKPVVLLDKYVRNEKGQYILDGKCEPRIGFAVGWNAAIRAAGGKVEGNADAS